MKKRIHILTIRDHFKMMVEPGAQWHKEIWYSNNSKNYRQRFGSRAQPGASYPWLVTDDGEPIVYFKSMEDSDQFKKQKSEECPPLPKPPAPPPPFPIGTYYMLEAVYYEIRQIARKSKPQWFGGNEWTDQPYKLVSGWFGGQDILGTWQEKFLAKYDDREQALAHLRRLIHEKRHEPLVIEGTISADDEQVGKR